MNYVRIVLTAAALAWSSLSLAAVGVAYGPVNTLIVKDATIAFFAVGAYGSAIPGTPCAGTSQFYIDLTTAGGQAMVQQLLHAQALGQSVWASGLGSCNYGRELIDYVQILYN